MKEAVEKWWQDLNQHLSEQNKDAAEKMVPTEKKLIHYAVDSKAQFHPKEWKTGNHPSKLLNLVEIQVDGNPVDKFYLSFEWRDDTLQVGHPERSETPGLAFLMGKSPLNLQLENLSKHEELEEFGPQWLKDFSQVEALMETGIDPFLWEDIQPDEFVQSYYLGTMKRGLLKFVNNENEEELFIMCKNTDTGWSVYGFTIGFSKSLFLEEFELPQAA